MNAEENVEAFRCILQAVSMRYERQGKRGRRIAYLLQSLSLILGVEFDEDALIQAKVMRQMVEEAVANTLS